MTQLIGLSLFRSNMVVNNKVNQTVEYIEVVKIVCTSIN